MVGRALNLLAESLLRQPHEKDIWWQQEHGSISGRVLTQLRRQPKTPYSERGKDGGRVFVLSLVASYIIPG